MNAEEQVATKALKSQLAAFNEKFGAFAFTQLLLAELVNEQRKSTINKADYQGDDFRVTVSVKKRK